MKRDLIILFLILLAVDFLLGDVRYLISSKDKMDALDNIFSLHYLWLNITFIVTFLAFGMLTFFFLSKFYPEQKAKCIFLILTAMVLSVFSRFFLEEIVGRILIGFGNYRQGIGLGYYFLDNCFYSITYGAIAMSYFFINYSFRKEQEKLELIVQNKATQLQLLKSQVNPHFLFNNLNNIYSLVYQKSENALPVIDKLSIFLRYSLYEVDQKVKLKQELSQINNFIELQKMRYEKPLSYTIKIDKIDESQELPPLLFFPFIENAFKHGDLHSKEHPIQIRLKQVGQYYHFSISNKKVRREKDMVGGIGLENIKERLKLLYGNKHEFQLSQQDDFFIVNLKIPIQA